MSYEPRSRGMRSRRISTKKPAAKETRSEEDEYAYKEPVIVDPQEVSSRLTNSLEHLGNQRFGMPPFAEHFHRWVLDVEAALNDFRNSLPDAADQGFDDAVKQLVLNVRGELDGRIASEEALSAKIAEAQHQLSDNERQLAELESAQRTQVNEARRHSEKSMKKIRGEIDALDDQRLKMIRHKPTILERVFGSARERIDNTSRSLQSRRTDLHGKQENLKQRLSALRSEYEAKRKPLVSRQAELRDELTKLRATTLDDALEIRKTVCDQLRKAVEGAVTQAAASSADKENPQ